MKIKIYSDEQHAIFATMLRAYFWVLRQQDEFDGQKTIDFKPAIIEQKTITLSEEEQDL